MFLVDVLSVLTGSSKLMLAELSTGRLHSRVDMWRHRGGMSCACPGRLEVSGGIVEAKHVTLERHSSSAVDLDLTNTNSCQLNSTHMTPTNCSRITSLPHEPNWELEVTSSFLTLDWDLISCIVLTQVELRG